MKTIRNLFRSDTNTVTFGDPAEPHTLKTIRVRKITIAKARELMQVIGSIPMIAINVLNAPPKERAAYLLVAVQQSLDDFVRIVSVTTELDAEYIENNVSIDQVVEYLVKLAEYNDFNAIVKNVQRGLTVLKGENQTAVQSSGE